MAHAMQTYLSQWAASDNVHTSRTWWGVILDGITYNVPYWGNLATSQTCAWVPWQGTRSLTCKVLYLGLSASWCNSQFYYGRQWSLAYWQFTTGPDTPTSHVLFTGFPAQLNEYDCAY